METLFNDSDFFVRDRPTRPTKSQAEKFFQEKAREIIDNGWSRDDPGVIISLLEELAPFYPDGYELAKMLEESDVNFNIDTHFVVWLHELEAEYQHLIDCNVERWIKALKKSGETQE